MHICVWSTKNPEGVGFSSAGVTLIMSHPIQVLGLQLYLLNQLSNPTRCWMCFFLNNSTKIY